jgi:hypothetical protein
MKSRSGRVNPTREGYEMPQENSGRKVKSHQQMIQALELRAAGASFRQIGEALSVSKPRAFRIVRKALDELVEHCTDTAERVRQLELHRLELHAKAAGDPDWDKGIRYFGSPEYERQWPGKPTRLVTAFVKAMPFGEERYTLTQGADANAR